MSKLFIEKRVSDTIKVLPGDGTLTIPISFVPEYIKTKFIDADHTRGADTLVYDINYVGDPDHKYDLVLTWTVAGTQARRIKYTVAKLASFHGSR